MRLFWPPSPLNVTFLHSKLLLDNSASVHIIKDERLVSKMEGKTKFSRRLKQFDGLTTWLSVTEPDPHILRQIYATIIRCAVWSCIAIYEGKCSRNDSKLTAMQYSVKYNDQSARTVQRAFIRPTCGFAHFLRRGWCALRVTAPTVLIGKA